MDDWRIRRDLTIPAAPETVWRWVAEPELISRWWCPPPTVTLRFEPHAGGTFEEHYRDGERSYDLVGTVVTYVPARRVSFRRETPGRFGPADLIDITLTGDAERTTVAIEHSFERLAADRRDEAHDLYADAWSHALGLLGDLVLSAGRRARATR